MKEKKKGSCRYEKITWMFCFVVVVIVWLFVMAELTFEMLVDFENKPLFDLNKIKKYWI
jgi:hypothetical protein